MISIITPFKNTGDFLPECIESVLNQSYGKWEWLLVDDHSTDGSYGLVDTYARKDSRLTLLKNPGKGIIPALQEGFRQSRGNYITRMDSDDLMPETKLETLRGLLSRHGEKHVATGLVKYFSDRGISDGYARYETWLNRLTATGQNYSEIYKECVIASPCWMVHRDDFLACGGFDRDTYPEDYDLVFRFYKHGYKVIPCDRVLHYWRDYDSRTSRTHEHYTYNYFLNIKLKYFLGFDRDPERPLAVWGAGKKGKAIARMLVERDAPFHWVCDNPKKIGRQVYGQILQNIDFLTKLQTPQSIVTVANEEAQAEIQAWFAERDMKAMEDFYFFC